MLATALKNHFGNNHQAELNRVVQRKGMNLPELAEDVEHLTNPEAAEAMIVVFFFSSNHG